MSRRNKLSPEEQRKAIALVLEHGISQKAVAQRFGCSDGTINLLLREARAPRSPSGVAVNTKRHDKICQNPACAKPFIGYGWSKTCSRACRAAWFSLRAQGLLDCSTWNVEPKPMRQNETP